MGTTEEKAEHFDLLGHEVYVEWTEDKSDGAIHLDHVTLGDWDILPVLKESDEDLLRDLIEEGRE